MWPFSKCTALRTPLSSRLRRISLAHSELEVPPAIVNGIDGSFRLSKTAVRNELRNCSFTVTVASPAGALPARGPRVADSCADEVAETKTTSADETKA